MLSKYKPSAKYGVSDKKDFKVYEKVFARMRTFAPWPAKILPQQFPGSSVNNMLKNCIVYFYGTRDMGECSFANIYDYEANKDRFRDMYLSSKKDPRIEDAFKHAELDDGSKDDLTEPFADEVLEFSAPLNVLWEREQKKMESKRRKTRKSDDETQDEETATQPPGYESQEDPDDFDNTEDDHTADDDDDDDYETKSRSRSRNRIKRVKGTRARKPRARSRKKIGRGQSRPRSDSEMGPDDESQAGMLSTDDVDDLTGIVFKTFDPVTLVVEYCLKDMDIHETNPRSLSKLEDGAANLIYRASVITAILPDGNIVELPVRTKSSVGGPGVVVTGAELSSLMSRTEEYEKLKIKLENGNPIPPEYSSLILPQLTPEHQSELKAKRAKMEHFLTIETDLINEEHKLRTLLTMAHMDFKGAFKSMDTIMQLDVRPLMLKKNPYVVGTIKLLQNYDVSNIKLRLPVEQRHALETQAERVRCLADFIMEMFSCLFEYQEEEMNFYRAFYLELVAFYVETRGVPAEDVMLLTD